MMERAVDEEKTAFLYLLERLTIVEDKAKETFTQEEDIPGEKLLYTIKIWEENKILSQIIHPFTDIKDIDESKTEKNVYVTTAQGDVWVNLKEMVVNKKTFFATAPVPQKNSEKQEQRRLHGNTCGCKEKVQDKGPK